jgi:DNA-binding MarR family transcriptional regulator
VKREGGRVPGRRLAGVLALALAGCASSPPAPQGSVRVNPEFDIAEVDEVIHGRVRLGIMAYLSGTGGAADFGTLKAKLRTTDGNLSVHLSKLEEAGYVRIEKAFVGKKPLTRAHLTDEGWAAFRRYLDAIGALLAPAAQ